MRLVTLDFETFYSQEYSLTRMSTEDYVTDPRFEVILVGAKVNNEPVDWFSGTMAQTRQWLEALRLEDAMLVAHNTMFDGLILQHHFGIVPKLYGDTMGMAQAVIRPFQRSISLKACLEHAKVGVEKGTAVHNMIGRPRLSLSRAELRDYADYCCDDVEGTFRLFKFLLPSIPRDELRIIDVILRMYLQPVLRLDANLLAEILAETRAKKLMLMGAIEEHFPKDVLMSNDKFAAALEKLGAEPPKKVSPTTGKLTWAFAKGDPEFKAFMEEHADDAYISAAIDARLGVKSTIEESRTERLLQIAQKHKRLRVPLRYYAAHTGRLGGMEKINMQNPPRIDKSRLRYAMLAPPGHVIMGPDLSQIEARVTAWLAKQYDLLEQFRQKRDVYSEFATIAYKRKITKADKTERFVGKTCILGLGFGMGHLKLKTTLAKDNVRVEEKESKKLVDTYRNTYSKIPDLWRFFDYAIPHVASGRSKLSLGPCELAKGCIILPNEMPIVYPRLRRTTEGEEWVYNFGDEVRTIWGGKMTENVVQALARIIVMENMLTIQKELGLRPALQVHDELDYVVKEEQAESLAAAITEIMSIPPAWATDLPVAVEVNWGPTFGDCK